MAEFKRKTTDTHIELGTVVPLAQPFVLLVDPSNLCNHKCKFCPSGNLRLIKETGRKQTFLDFDLYKKIINDIKDFEEPIKVLRLYKEGEPLLNPHFSDMVKFAKDSNLVKRIDTTSNGLCLNKDLNRKIVGAGLDQINISVNGVSSKQIEFYTRTKVDFDQYVKNIEDLYKNRGSLEIYVKCIKENLNEEEERKFFDIFGPISDRIFLEHLSPVWPEHECDADVQVEYSTGHYGQQIIERKICPYIFYMMVVNSDGTSSFCVGDWKHCLIAGNLNYQSLKEVWLGDILNQARLQHVMGNRGLTSEFCKNCEVVKYATLDNLDPYQDEILKRMNSK